MDQFHLFDNPASQGTIVAACGFSITAEEVRELLRENEVVIEVDFSKLNDAISDAIAFFLKLPPCPLCMATL